MTLISLLILTLSYKIGHEYSIHGMVSILKKLSWEHDLHIFS